AANLLMLFVGIVAIRATVRILTVPSAYIAPTILAFCLIGAYVASYDNYSIIIAVSTGILAYVLYKAGLPLGPLGLGLVLGPIAEQGLGQSLVIAQAQGTLHVLI